MEGKDDGNARGAGKLTWSSLGGKAGVNEGERPSRPEMLTTGGDGREIGKNPGVKRLKALVDGRHTTWQGEKEVKWGQKRLVKMEWASLGPQEGGGESKKGGRK